MTMSTSHRWSVGRAKAQFSAMLAEAEHAPQLVERRGKPVAVVVSADDFARIGKLESGTLFGARWRRFLDISSTVRGEGGAVLKIPRRRPRASPFERKSR
jgi:prevent-host-death family protein